jgi:hypothetical protein
MASYVVAPRRDGRIAPQEVHELGSRKTKPGIKIFRRAIKSDPPGGMIYREKSLTVSSFDTVRLPNDALAVSI